MSEPRRMRLDAYVFLQDLIDATVSAVDSMAHGEVGTWQAERLEQAAKTIRENNVEKPNETA